MELLGSINNDKNNGDATSQDYDKLYKKLSSETFDATNRILDLCSDLKEKSFHMNNTLDVHNDQLNRIDSGLDKMNDDLSQVNNDLKYLNKSSKFFKSLFCCFGFRNKKCSPFKYLISKLRPNRMAKNIPYIVINEEKDEQQTENDDYTIDINQLTTNRSINDNISKKISLTNSIEKNKEPPPQLLKIEANTSNVIIDDNLKLIGSAIGDLQLMMAGFSQKIDEQAKKIETTGEKTQTTTDKVKRVNKLGENLLGVNKSKYKYLTLV